MNTTNLEQLEIEQLSKMWEAAGRNPKLQESIEDILQGKIQDNLSYSREDLFELSVIKRRTPTIYFIPTTDAYEAYGPYITMNISFDEEERMEILENLSANPPRNSYGAVTAKPLLTEEDLTQEQIDRLENEGFDTREILEILDY